ncbi:hypothetical protein ABW12_06700 [Pluralibacter gergoviae]|nr:hypothetical protein ABW12_06700 [Pluralibacter gergoviae]
MLLHLPPDLQAACDLSTLQLESGSFVEPGLRPFFSDVLYSMKTVSGHSGYVHVLIEHQSTPDKQMAFRLMRYAVGAMQRHLDAGHTALPLVIPVLFYAGRRTPYPYSTRWLDAFAEPALAEKLYSGHFPLVDVTTIADDRIMTHRRMAALTLLQKHIHRRDLSALVERLAQLLREEPIEQTQLAALINYLVQTGETSEAEAFVRELARRVPQHGEQLMTIAEQLEQNGFRKGVEMTKREVARSMLQNGIDWRLVSKVTGLTKEQVAQLRH